MVKIGAIIFVCFFAAVSSAPIFWGKPRQPIEDETLYYRNIEPDNIAIESETKALLSPPPIPSNDNEDDNIPETANHNVNGNEQNATNDKDKRQGGDHRQDIEGEAIDFSSLEPPPVNDMENVIQPEATHFCLPPVNVNLNGQTVSSSYELSDDCVNENEQSGKTAESLQRPLSERQNFNFGQNSIEYDDGSLSNEHGTTIYVPPLNFKNVPYLSLQGIQQNQAYQQNQGFQPDYQLGPGYQLGQSYQPSQGFAVAQGFQPRPFPKQLPKPYRVLKSKNRKPYVGKTYKTINPIRPIPPLQPLSPYQLPYHSLASHSIASQPTYPHPNPFNPYAQPLTPQSVAPSQPSPFHPAHSIPSHVISHHSIPQHLLSNHHALAQQTISPHLIAASQTLSPESIPSHLLSHQSLAPQSLSHESISSHPVTLQSLQGVSHTANAGGELFLIVVDPSNQRPGIYNGGSEHIIIHVPYHVHTDHIHHHHVSHVPVWKPVPVVKHVPIYNEVHVPIVKPIGVPYPVHIPVHHHHQEIPVHHHQHHEEIPLHQYHHEDFQLHNLHEEYPIHHEEVSLHNHHDDFHHSSW